jgi:cyclophilin family peptidyl-prolyl cis-trans isomerase
MSVTLRIFLLSIALSFSAAVFAQDEPKVVGDPKSQVDPEKKADDAKKTDAKKPDEEKADEKKPDEPKATEKKDPEKKDPEKKDTEKKETEKKGPVAQFEALSKRKLAIFNKLKKLEKDFEAAESNAKKIEIRDQFEDAVREFNVDVYPEMIELAPKVYAADPKNLDAGEMVLQAAFNKNQYEKTYEIAQALLKADRKTRAVLNSGGVAAYAIHDFETAHALLKDAQERGMISERYSVYIDYAEKYKEYWQAEQEIRKHEAELKGAQALPRVEFNTSKGKIVFELFEDDAPNTVANFVSLVEAKKYDGIKFHRVIPNFMCQGGDPNTLDEDPTNDGLGGPDYKIKCECFERENPRMHFRGTLSMAHAGKDTGGSQFFITHLPTAWLNAKTEPVESGHTVFGRVVTGLDVVDSIQKGDVIQEAKVLNKRAHEYKPVKVGDEENADDPKVDDPKKTTKEDADDKKTNDTKKDATDTKTNDTKKTTKEDAADTKTNDTKKTTKEDATDTKTNDTKKTTKENTTDTKTDDTKKTTKEDATDTKTDDTKK